MPETPTPSCPACNGTGSCDSGGETPWGAPIEVRCECAYPEQHAPTAQQPTSIDWHFWSDDPPPGATKIQATYSLSQPWMDGETCKRGCLCFCHDQMGCMRQPNFWRYPPTTGAAP